MTKQTKANADNGGSPEAARDQEVRRRLETLREEYEKLNEQRIATERDRKNLEEQLSDLRDKAMKEYGTSDIEDLRKLLAERRAENEKLVEGYRVHIEGIKTELDRIDSAEIQGEQG